jgi:hypothetical protein
MTRGSVLQGFSFFPRGGSAQVVRYLTGALLEAGWAPQIAAGSLGPAGSPSHAETFFAGLPLSVADFTPALDAWQRGEDPLDQPVPLHASYEDKPGAPDRVFAAVSPELAERQVESWRRLLVGLRPFDPQVLHLHHLTPLHDAAESVWPDVPVVTHLHGTELLMLAPAARDLRSGSQRRGGTPAIGRTGCGRLLSAADAFLRSPLTTPPAQFACSGYPKIE